MQELVTWLGESAPGTLTWAYQHYPNDTHRSTPHRTLLDGLEFVFSGWKFQPSDSKESADEAYQRLRAWRAEMQGRYGFEAVPAALDLFVLGTGLMRRGKPEQALAVAAEALRLRPRGPENAYLFMMLAELLEERGSTVEALEAYRQALEVRVWAGPGYDDWFAQRIRRIPQKIEALEAALR